MRILLGIALARTQKGFVNIEATPSTDGIAISVIDSGIAVFDDQPANNFEPYRQKSNDPRQNTDLTQEGTGLSLALARALAQRMDGQLTLETTLQQGNRFTLTLPLTPTE